MPQPSALFCHGCLFCPRRRRRRKKQNKKHKTLILSKRIDAPLPPPPPRCFFSLSHRFCQCLPLLDSCALFTPPPPDSFPLSSSQGASVDLAVVTRLMDDSESGVGRGWGSEGEKTGRQGRRALCNHFIDVCCAQSS